MICAAVVAAAMLFKVSDPSVLLQGYPGQPGWQQH
jgi:hypothetical protein